MRVATYRTQRLRAFAGLVATNDSMRIGYGLGFMALRHGAFTWTGHTGGVAGYTAAMFFRPSQRGVIVFRNATGGKATIDVAATILERLTKTAPVKSAAAHYRCRVARYARP